MPAGQGSFRVAIAGAASLQGQDLKQQIESSGYPADEVRLFDDELAAETLSEFSGEATVIQPIDESSFRGLRFVFFAGPGAFARQHGPEAVRAGAGVIDLTGALDSLPGAKRWIPRLDSVLPPPPASPVKGVGNVCIAPSTPAIVACSFSAALRDFKPVRVVLIFFEPASGRGRNGLEELEDQMVKLFSLQSIPQEVFDTQVAFNLIDRWGPKSQGQLSAVRDAFALEVRDYLAGRMPVPAMNLIQAPVFFGQAFAAYAEFAEAPSAAALGKRLEAAGFRSAGQDEPGPSNVGAAGESEVMLSFGVQDPGVSQGMWFWGAADNLRLASSNAVQIAERMLVS